MSAHATAARDSAYMGLTVRERGNRVKQDCASHCERFFENTSIHGVKYLSEKGRSIVERLIWLSGIIATVVFCGYLLNEAWNKKTSTPVIMVMDKTQSAVWDIPFPATTICPSAKFSRNYIQLIKGATNETQESNGDKKMTQLLDDLQLLCEDDRIHITRTKLKNSSTIDVIEREAFNITDIILFKSFGHKKTDIDLARTFTDEGVCYTFNMLPSENMFHKTAFYATRLPLNYRYKVQWSMEGGYDDNAEADAYPFRAVGAGKEAGLKLILFTRKSQRNVNCTFTSSGFEMRLNAPDSYPFEEKKIFIPFNNVVHVTLKPHQILTDKNVYSYPTEKRGCFRPGERNLTFFREYTQKNCEMECLSKIYLEHCQCVPFYMPRKESTHICGPDACPWDDAALKLSILLQASGLKSNSMKLSDKKFNCNCLPRCSDITYNSEVSRTEMATDALSSYLESRINWKDAREYDIAVVFVYFTESSYVPFYRLELYGTVEFLASCGGFLGLCLGMSVLSVIELLYWLLVRPLCHPTQKAEGPRDSNSSPI